MLCLHKATERAGVTVGPLWHREPQQPRGQSFLSIVQENYRGPCHATDGNRPEAPSCPTSVSCLLGLSSHTSH